MMDMSEVKLTKEEMVIFIKGGKFIGHTLMTFMEKTNTTSISKEALEIAIETFEREGMSALK